MMVKRSPFLWQLDLESLSACVFGKLHILPERTFVAHPILANLRLVGNQASSSVLKILDNCNK